MIPSYTRPTKIIVDLSTIKKNISGFRRKFKNEKEVFAVVKANAYGHGAVRVARAAIEAGAKGVCVSNLDEAIELRDANIIVPILVLGYVPLNFVNIAIQNDITLTATNLEWIRNLDNYLTAPLKIHLKIDTGMNRVGIIKLAELEEAKSILTENPYINFEGIFTHFSTADTLNSYYVQVQKQRFDKYLNILGNDFKYIHTSNSALALYYDAWKSDIVRLGISMYGFYPSKRILGASSDLEEALSLVTETVHIKELDIGEKVGYGAEYEATQKEWIVTLPIGYADGLNRKFKGYKVIINGEFAPIIGKICMDQCMVRVKERVPIGTKVTIFGRNGPRYNYIKDASNYVGMTNYELLCSLTDRIPRIYKD